MSLVDLTGTKWVFKNLPSIGISEKTYNINFISNSHNYTQLYTINGLGEEMYYMDTSSTSLLVYEDIETGWTSQIYRIIDITGGSDTANSSLISWLMSNATRVQFTDLTMTSWKINLIPQLPSSSQNYMINFTTYGETPNTLSLLTSSISYQDEMGTLGPVYFTSSGWQNEKYRLIKINNGLDVTNPELILWLTNNAVEMSKAIIGNKNILLKTFGNKKVLKEVVNKVVIYENENPPLEDWTFGISGLTNSNPVLTRTDDSANFTWTKNSSTGVITSDFDQYFNFKRVTHSGSTFVRIPKMYFKRTNDTIQLSNHAQTGFSVHPCFLNESGQENDYYDVGCYKAYNDNNVLKSVSGATLREVLSLTDCRTYARANNTGRDRQYFVEDIRYLSLIWMLWMIVWATRQTDTIMGTSWYGPSFPITGNTDNLVNNTLLYPKSICGQDPTTHSFKFYGIEDIIGAGYEWVDGITFDSTSIKVSLNPSEYSSDTFTNYVTLSFTKPSTTPYNDNIVEMGLDSNNPAIMFPNSVSQTAFNTYYCDGVLNRYVGFGNALCFGSNSYGTSNGVFCCNYSNDFSDTSSFVRSRLCSQPLGDTTTYANFILSNNDNLITSDNNNFKVLEEN